MAARREGMTQADACKVELFYQPRLRRVLSHTHWQFTHKTHWQALLAANTCLYRTVPKPAWAPGDSPPQRAQIRLNTTTTPALLQAGVAYQRASHGPEPARLQHCTVHQAGPQRTGTRPQSATEEAARCQEPGLTRLCLLCQGLRC